MNLFKSAALQFKFKVWAKLKANKFPSFNYSHSQFGEDMILRFLTQDKNKGFYVDIGAFHPIYISNTYHFYCKGWKGINIDAKPGSMNSFNILRPRDTNLEFCISSEEKEVTFFVFDQSPFNTCDPEVAEQLITSRNVKLINKHKLKALTLSSILERYLPEGTEIDFMNIDVEGMDETIIRSNNWNLFRPKILIFENHELTFKDSVNNSTVKYLEQFGYKFVTKCGYSVILAQKDNDYLLQLES